MTQPKRMTVATGATDFDKVLQWSDAVWTFPVTTAGMSKSASQINWAFPLLDGGLFTDSLHSVALEAWKRILWTMLNEPPDGHPRKGSYCGKFGTGIRFIVPWMLSTGRQIGDLDGSALDEFLVALAVMASDDELDDEAGNTDVTISAYLTIFSLPYVTRNILRDKGLPFPADDPLRGKHPMAIAREVSRKVVRQTQEVSDAVFVATLNAATTMLELPWVEPLIKFCNDFNTASLNDDDLMYTSFKREYLPDRKKYGGAVGSIRDAVMRLRSACHVIIQACSALRLSELCGIETGGFDYVNYLPKCIRIERTFDDEYELFVLDAKLFKHTSSSEPQTWVLGMRPTGASYLPPPVSAIDILYRLDAGWRKLAGIDTLLIQFSTSLGLPRSARDIAPASGHKVRLYQQRWLIEAGCAAVDQRITTHMWRKTFARYLIRVSADLLPAISHHLKHMSIAMTEVGYCKPEPAMRQFIADARVEEAGSVILGIITGQKRVAGPIAAEIQSLGGKLARRLGNRPPDDVARDVEAEVRERRFELYGSEVGWCVFRSESARCHVLATEPVPPFLRLAPEFDQRRPEVCQKCENFGIGDEHYEFWRERHSALRSQLAQCTPDTPPSLRTCLKRSMGRCETVLSWMDEGDPNAR